MSWYCYGISRDSLDAAGLKGLQGRPIERISVRPLAMLTSALEPEVFVGVEEEGLLPDSRLARLAAEHDTTVSRLFERGPILPLRMGIFLRDQAGAMILLRDQAAEWLQALDRVEGKAEWICKVRLVETGSPPATEPPNPDARTGTAYIEQMLSRARAAQGRQDRMNAQLEQLHTGLMEHAADANPVSGAASDVMLSVAYLVSRRSEEAFRSAMDMYQPLLAEQGCACTLTGPWPPYHFAVDLKPEVVHAPA